MSLIFITPDLSPKAKDYIKSNIPKLNGYVTSNQESADIIVCNNLCFLKPSTVLIPRISFICFKSMVEQDINPFTFNYKSKLLVNLFFMNKSFMFYQTSPQKIQQCTKIIELMCGTVKKEDADYCLTEKQDEQTSKHLISVAWIYALQHSSFYIPPDSYIISKRKSSSQPKKSLSQPRKKSLKSAFKGQLQIYCSDKPECPIFPRIISQKPQIHSQSINLPRKGELTIFVGNSSKSSSKIGTNAYSQKFEYPPIKKQIKNIPNTQSMQINTANRSNHIQNSKLSIFENSKKIELTETKNHSSSSNLRQEIMIDFVDQLTSFSQVMSSDQEDEYSNDVRYEMNKPIEESDTEIGFSQDPILLAFS